MSCLISELAWMTLGFLSMQFRLIFKFYDYLACVELRGEGEREEVKEKKGDLGTVPIFSLNFSPPPLPSLPDYACCAGYDYWKRFKRVC